MAAIDFVKRAAVYGLLGCLGCSDPVHDSAVAALGGEDPNVPAGPNHRPGQPCLVCHGGAGPASIQFGVGGTVYAVKGRSGPAVGALVRIEDSDGQVNEPKTNSVGNFFVSSATFAPHFPVQVQVTSPDGNQTSQMFSTSNRDGSCADCHGPSPGPSSPGPVFVYFNAVDTGGDGGSD